MSYERLYSPGPTDIRKSRRFWIEPGEDQELLIGKGKRILLALRHTIADNIYCLLRKKIVEKAFHDRDLNCHATAAIALDEGATIEWGTTHYRGEHMSIDDALASLPLPCGMQIHASGEFSCVLHSSVLLGPADGPALAFHKNGILPMELCPMQNIITDYRKHYGDVLLTFYAARPIVR